MLSIVPYRGQAGTLERVGQGYTPALAPQKPPTMWEWYRRIKELENPYPDQETKLQAGVNVVRHNAESAALAAILGFVSGEFNGLDIRGKYPVDGIAAIVLGALSVSRAGTPDGFSADLRALGQTCTSVYVFRMAERWRIARKTIDTTSEDMNIHTSPKPASSAKPAPTIKRGSILNDPILEAGKAVGL